MRTLHLFVFVLLLTPLAGLVGCSSAQTAELSSWNDGPSRAAIESFVDRVVDPNSPDYVPPAERIAVFDNDGTLWAEQPAYFQLLFAIDRVRAMAPDHPEWRNNPTFQAVLDNDMQRLAAGGDHAVLELVMATHADLTTDEFDAIVRDWLATARHPKTGRPYTEMVYQPMLEVLDYLRAHDFETYIVSGGGVDFMRVFAEDVYGIPPEQVVGSAIAVEYRMTEDGPVIQRVPDMNFVNDKSGKPIGIHRFIGRRPIAAFGNSDGDLQMLQWTEGRAGASLCVIVRHTDAAREWAYDRDSSIGRLDLALEDADVYGWTVVDMADEWMTVFPE